MVNLLVLVQLFRPNLVGHGAGPRNEPGTHRRWVQARTPGPHPLRGYPAYIVWYVAGSALGPATPLGEVNWNGTSGLTDRPLGRIR